MPLLSVALTKQKLCIDFAALKHACPNGVYVAPLPDQPLRWSGVVFVRKGCIQQYSSPLSDKPADASLPPQGQYANAVLRFLLDFPPDYPRRPPILSFLSDVFHPLVTPLSTYTYTSRDPSADTFSASDRDRLPPGGLNLSHAFPEWFERPRDGALQDKETHSASGMEHPTPPSRAGSAALTAEVLQYMRVVLDTEAILDAVPLEAAANLGAWHAWRSYRAKSMGGRSASPLPARPGSASDRDAEPSSSSRQQPGGARRPADWNWQGVWEERVKKSIQASNSDHMLYAGDTGDLICFSKLDPLVVDEMISAEQTSSRDAGA